jgi:hypothetical protein
LRQRFRMFVGTDKIGLSLQSAIDKKFLQISTLVLNF